MKTDFSAQLRLVLYVAALLLLGGLFVWLAAEDGSGSIMFRAVMFKAVVAVIAAGTLRIVIKIFDGAINLDFPKLVEKTTGASFAVPLFLYTGLRFIGLCILFGCIFSA